MVAEPSGPSVGARYSGRGRGTGIRRQRDRWLRSGAPATGIRALVGDGGLLLLRTRRRHRPGRLAVPTAARHGRRRNPARMNLEPLGGSSRRVDSKARPGRSLPRGSREPLRRARGRNGQEGCTDPQAIRECLVMTILGLHLQRRRQLSVGVPRWSRRSRTDKKRIGAMTTPGTLPSACAGREPPLGWPEDRGTNPRYRVLIAHNTSA